MVTETGLISLSIDGLGTNNVAGGTISASKPAGATVRSAWLAAAATGFTNRVLANGDVKIDGAGVTFTSSKTQSFGGTATNAWGDVTSLVKPKLDAAPAGIVNFTITEVTPASIDGEVLAVIFNDPNQTTTNTVVLLFGALSTTGDTFQISLASPINKSDPKLLLDLSLGISFSCQDPSPANLCNVPTQPLQFSTVDVNGQRMTSSAGGADDGAFANGALLTAGGFDDSDVNPAAPNSNTSPDDELYSLLPFVNTGDTVIKVATLNPSNDDNIFFSGLFLRSVTASVGESITFSPVTATNPLGASHTLTATVVDASGAPISGRVVTFTVLSGPNAGITRTATTNAQGTASASYTGNAAGTDSIQASFQSTTQGIQTSNTVTKIWQAAAPAPGATPSPTSTPVILVTIPGAVPSPVIPVFQNPSAGAFFNPIAKSPTPRPAVAAAAPPAGNDSGAAVFRPPNTGDAGLKVEDE